MSELRPCPFCGGEAKLWNNSQYEPCLDEGGAYVDIFISSADTFGVECTKCCCQNIGYNTEQEAIETWNRRAGDKHGD
jgi:hypothetical protein